MLIEIITNTLFGILKSGLGGLPVVDIVLSYNELSIIGSAFSFMDYFFPIKAIMPIILIYFSIDAFHIVWRIVLRVKYFVPFW